ncbi:MAG: hypothetical protein M1818_008501 [Claussenomyces sp. TS43310]|nr:MAG: hypothetical protein M1818_008501 [Claussenomyces sp. TS43310]
MNCGDVNLSPPYVSSYHDGPYNSSLASSASSSAASIWSDAASQSSDDSSVHSSGVSCDSEVSDSYCYTNQQQHQTTQDVCEQGVAAVSCWPKSIATNHAPEQRLHPRRTCTAATVRSGCPPALVRQCDRKVNFVDSLVDSSAQIVEAIWPLASIVCRSEMGHKGVLPLRTFIQETLRRSRTSYSTLQVALYYLILIKPHVPKHDFTMEQSEDAPSFRALQCGRRMFLAALILASKYLQDRNYSARAWSKISGLNTQEINQNEIAFLLAVNWRLHITDDVFQRWTDIVLKYTPPQPPSSGAIVAGRPDPHSADWKSIVLGLNPELDNIDHIIPARGIKAGADRLSPPSKCFVEKSYDVESGSNESTPTPKYYIPNYMEPSPSTVYPPIRAAPALGLLPTPKLTPQSVGCSTPAVSAASCTLGKSSMGLAMAQASSLCASQAAERWATASPQPCVVPGRRSSLANSVSSMSSPESMVSDSSSRSSRSSSISSASGLTSAPLTSKLDVQARCRYAKQCSERQRTIFAAVPEQYGPSSSPESYCVPTGKDFIDLSRDLSLNTPLARDYNEAEHCARVSDTEAAQVLQELHNNPRAHCSSQIFPTRRAKRSRPESVDYSNALQENVRGMLGRVATSLSSETWSENLVRTRPCPRSISYDSANVIVNSVPKGVDGRKRVCCLNEGSKGFSAQGPDARPGMWNGILN